MRIILNSALFAMSLSTLSLNVRAQEVRSDDDLKPIEIRKPYFPSKEVRPLPSPEIRLPILSSRSKLELQNDANLVACFNEIVRSGRNFDIPGFSLETKHGNSIPEVLLPSGKRLISDASGKLKIKGKSAGQFPGQWNEYFVSTCSEEEVRKEFLAMLVALEDERLNSHHSPYENQSSKIAKDNYTACNDVKAQPYARMLEKKGFKDRERVHFPRNPWNGPSHGGYYYENQ